MNKAPMRVVVFHNVILPPELIVTLPVTFSAPDGVTHNTPPLFIPKVDIFAV